MASLGPTDTDVDDVAVEYRCVLLSCPQGWIELQSPAVGANAITLVDDVAIIDIIKATPRGVERVATDFRNSLPIIIDGRTNLL